MIVTLLHRMADTPKPIAIAPLRDITSGQYYTKVVAWAYKNGIVNGCSAEVFEPNDAITCEQMAVILWRFLQSTGG